jgi:hypothetical protein
MLLIVLVKLEPALVPTAAPLRRYVPPEGETVALMLLNAVVERVAVPSPRAAWNVRTALCLSSDIRYWKLPAAPAKMVPPPLPVMLFGRKKTNAVYGVPEGIGTVIPSRSFPSKRTAEDPLGVRLLTSVGRLAAVAWVAFEPTVAVHVPVL